MSSPLLLFSKNSFIYFTLSVVVSALSQVEVDVKVLIKSNQAKIKLPVEGQSWSWRRRGEFDLRGERYVLP